MRGHNARTMKRLNRGTVLRLLRRQSLSRLQLARTTGLQESTISLIVGELLADGLVREDGPPAPRARRRGRREVPLALHPDGAYAIGIHLGIFAAQVAVTNARAEMIAHVSEDLPSPPTPVAVVDHIRRLVRHVLLTAGVDPARLVGAGVGVLAYVEPASGVVRRADHLGWRDVPLAALLRDALGLPVAIDHNVRAMALAEQLYGRLGDLRDFAFLNVGTSIGAALVVNGRLVEGHAHDAGQLGHLLVAPDGPPCTCGRRGCLDAVASIRALRQRARELAEQRPGTPFGRRVLHHERSGQESVVLELAAAGDPLALACIEHGAEPLATVLAVLLALHDPEVVIVSAGASAHDAVLIPPLQAALVARAAVPDGAQCLAPSSFGRAQAVVGGAAVMLQLLFDAPDMLREVAGARRPGGTVTAGSMMAG